MTEKNVATYEQSEAVAEKEPTVFQEFTYDNESNGGVLNKFTEIDSKITEVKGFINELSGNYKTMVEKYDAFTNLSEQMDAIITTMNSRADNVAKYFNNIITSAEQAVEEHAKTDKNLMDDLDVLQGMLATGVGTEAGFKNNASAEAAFRASHNGYSQEEFKKLNDIQKEQVAKEAAKHDDKISANKEDLSGTSYDNMNKGDLEAIADDIIKYGSYGNGTDRYAELEAQGFDAQAIQDIVNQKMNGTYESGPAEFVKYQQTDGAKSAEAAQKIHDAQVRGRERTEAAQAAAAGGTKVSLDEDPVLATSAANTRGMEKENTAAEAGFAKANTGKNLTDQGYPSSRGGYGNNGTSSDKNLTAQGYPSSRDGYGNTGSPTGPAQNLSAQGYPSSRDGYGNTGKPTQSAAEGNLTASGYPSSTGGYGNTGSPTGPAQNLSAQGYPSSRDGYGNTGSPTQTAAVERAQKGTNVGEAAYQQPTFTGSYMDFLRAQGRLPESMTQNSYNDFTNVFSQSLNNNQTPPATNWQPSQAMVENMNNAVGIGSGVGGGPNTAKEVDR